MTTYLLWHIWKASNVWIFNGEKRTETKISQLVWEEWIQFKKEQNKGKKEMVRRIRLEKQRAWTTPDSRTIKVNVSSAYDPRGSHVGLGIIARDEHGRCVQALAVAKERVLNPMVAEVDAVRVALLITQ